MSLLNAAQGVVYYRSSWRSNAVLGTYCRAVHGGSADGCGCPGMRCNVGQGSAFGLSPLAVRFAYVYQHSFHSLASKCTQLFKPVDNGTKSSAKCCTTDITVAWFRTFQGNMDALYENATTVEYVTRVTPGWRTDLYAASGTLMTHAE